VSDIREIPGGFVLNLVTSDGLLQDVLEMRVRYTLGETIRSIQRDYPSVTWENVASVVKRNTWKHI